MVEGPDLSKSDEVLQGKNEAIKKRGKEDKRPTKVVIRKLPGTMTEESFLQHVSPLFEHDYFYFVQGENPAFGDHNYSRAYINFVNLDDVFTFTMKFDDYVFLDESGQEYPAIVEFAPFQRIPKNRNNRKNDSLCGTIDDDEDYQKFVQQLESEEQDHRSNQIAEHYFDLANDQNEEKITSTPLLEYLASRKNEWIKFKEEKKEERRRRDIERRKSKEENKRIKKENKELTKMKVIEKGKDDKRKETEIKPSEEVKQVANTRIKGKSYQEERQRDLARRKMEEKSGKGDAPENKGSDELEKTSSHEHLPENDADKGDIDKEIKGEKRDRETKYDDDCRRKNYEDKKGYRDDDRKFNSYPREKEDRKLHSYGVKKREYANGYEHDSKYKTGKSSGYFHDDYKTRAHSSYQKNAYSSKYGTNKGKDYDEKIKRFDKPKKYDGADYKEPKKSYQWERESRKLSDSKEDKKVTSESGKVGAESESRKEKLENAINSEDSTKDSKSCCSGKSLEVVSDSESARTKESKNGDKKDDRAERRIKNKDRPALEIYRPGMGKFSRQRLERNKSTDSKDGE